MKNDLSLHSLQQTVFLFQKLIRTKEAFLRLAIAHLLGANIAEWIYSILAEALEQYHVQPYVHNETNNSSSGDHHHHHHHHHGKLRVILYCLNPNMTKFNTLMCVCLKSEGSSVALI